MPVYKLKLPRLTHGWDKQPQLLERYWDILCDRLEEVLNQILEIPEIIDALAELDAATQAAQDAADAAQNAADNANNAAEATTSEQSLLASFPTDFVDPLISATDTGDVIIANHKRQYGDTAMNPTVPVTGATLPTGASAGSVIRVYYQDPSRVGGAVTYQWTIDPAPPPVQGGDTHSVGSVIVPVSGPPSGGGPVRPPGWATPIP